MSVRIDLVSGPHDYWSDDRPPSRGQHQAIAETACALLGIKLDTRFDATVALVRLRAAAEQQTPMPEVPEPW